VLAAALLLMAGSAFAAGHGGGGHSGGGRSGGGHSSGGHSVGGSHSSGGGSGHYAVPRSGGSGSGSHGHGQDRQPSFHGHDGGHHGGGFHGGGRGYYPYFYGGGYWPGLFFGWYWDDWGWDPYGYPYRYGYGYGHDYPYGYGHGYGREDREDMGALDLDISPGQTQVYVNGEKLGIVDNFDGWPQYLWLPKGTYDVVFYLEGYKTLARQVTVYPGVVIDMDDRMEQGPSTLPQDLQTKTHERRDERERYERDRSDRIDRGERGERDGGDWRDRVPEHRRHRSDDADRDGRYDRKDRDDRDGRDGHAGNGGWLSIKVEPEDASVYLDGQFVGTGSDLGRLERGLKVSPGKHHLAIVRPGRKAEEQDFDVTAGQNVRVQVDLDEN